MSMEFGKFTRDEKTGGYIGDFEMLDLTRKGVVSIAGMKIGPSQRKSARRILTSRTGVCSYRVR